MTDLSDISRCVKCGSCKAFCPTYGEEASEGMTARGRLMLLRGLRGGAIAPGPVLSDRLMSCTLCGICEASCPTGMEITEAIYEGRVRLAPADAKRKNLRKAARFSLGRPSLSFKAARFLRPLLPYLLRRSGVPFKVALPEAPLKNSRRVFKPAGRTKGRVALFTGCAVNYLYPRLGKDLIEVLTAVGYEVVLPPGEVCCGAPLRALGLEKEAVDLSRKNVDVFGRLRAEAVLSLCPTCTVALKAHYPRLTGRGMENAMDVSEFLAERLPARRRTGKASASESPPMPGPVVYHDPCHLRYGLGVKEEPREILRAMGFELDGREQGCCGFGVSLTHGELSEGLLDRRLADYGESSTVVTSCPACMMQLGRGFRKVFHIIELVRV
jgi:glycolate oxidase iron-sulfur subunit